MRLQTTILFYIMCLNLACWLALNPYTQILTTWAVVPWNPSVNATEYETHFNATEIADLWQATPFLGIPVVGDIFSGLHFLSTIVIYLFAGFPIFLYWVGDAFIVDSTARLSYNAFVVVLTALFGVLMSFWMIEFISGRPLNE